MPSPKHSPLLSVIIPTFNRPHFLGRAIKSAFHGAPDGDVEIIVVPNGMDESWKATADCFRHEDRVKWYRIFTGHANVARNYGKRLAKGKYIRFLDDDDFLLDASAGQISLAEKNNCEICAGNALVVYSDMNKNHQLKVDYKEDFAESILLPGRRTGFQFYLYLRLSVTEFQLDESIDIGQDTHWTHTLCRTKDWSWAYLDAPVCTWVQHEGQQISTTLGTSGHLKLQSAMLWDTILELEHSGRLTDSRRECAAKGMWGLIHNGFFLSPFYWEGIVNNTLEMFPGTFPDIDIYKSSIGRKMSPLLLEKVMLPKRWLNHSYRMALLRMQGDRGWR